MAAVTSVQNATTGAAALKLQQAQAQQAKQAQPAHHNGKPSATPATAPAATTNTRIGQNVDTKA